jgi:Tfp pilus assembly PilM family ATPase
VIPRPRLVVAADPVPMEGSALLGAKWRTATGFHFSGVTLRTVGLGRRRGRLVLHTAGAENLDRPFVPGDLVDDAYRGELAGAVQRLLQRTGRRPPRPVVAVDPQAALVKARPLLIGGVAGRRVRQANLDHLQWEMHQLLGDQGPLYATDCVLLPEAGFLVAVRRQSVELHTQVLAQAGARGAAVDVEPFALCNAAEALGILDGTDMEWIIHRGPTCLQALVLRAGRLAVVRRISADTVRSVDLAQLVDGCLLRLGRECDGDTLHRVWVTGEDVESLCQLLAARLGVPCAPFDPFAGMDLVGRGDELSDTLADGPAYAVAVGLACGRLLS